MADQYPPSRRNTTGGSRQAPSRRSGDETSSRRRAEDSGRQAAPRRSSSGDSRQSPPRRSDVIRCEKCGEDYSITYKRCPFCDERPGRSGISGRRVAGGRDGGYGGPVNPIQVIGLVVSLVLVIAALFIVFTYIGPLLFGDKDAGGGSSVSTSQGTGGQSSSQSGQDASQPDPGASSSGDSSQTQTPSVTVTSITLSRTDFTLAPGEIYQITATLAPDGVTETVTWSSSDTSLATVDEYGNVENVNQGTSLAKAVITATVGGQTAQCDVYCRPAQTSGGETGTSGEEPAGGGSGGSSTGTLSPNTQAVVVNAGGGLNVRSGPGTSYDRVASISNGDQVTILEAAEGGWYRIDCGGSVEGYVLGDYLSAG